MSDRRWTLIASKIRGADPALTVSQRICIAAGELLGASSVSLALVVDGAYSPVAATDEVGEFLDDQQFTFGDGPAFDAQRAEAPIIVEDVNAHRAATRWPVFVKLAQHHRVRGAFVFPLRIGDAHLGVLTAYRAHAGEPSAEAYADGLILASLATAELLSVEAGVGAELGTGIFTPGLYDQSALHVAAGMVAESLNISIVAALVRIRARAFADDQAVGHTAQLIVERRLVLEN